MEPLKPSERFISQGKEIDLTVSDFWTWGFSDLLDNTLRGTLAEFLVASACGNATVRVNWTPYDCTSPSGRRIEVKSAAYLQSWTDELGFSNIRFDISKNLAWSPENGWADTKRRNSDLYVFSVFTAMSKNQSVLNLDLWDFYVLATSVLDREIPEQKTIALGVLQKFSPVKASYFDLLSVIESIEL